MKAALALTLRASGIGPGDEVIVPAHTFATAALAVVEAGATPVLCDVQDGTGLIDADLYRDNFIHFPSHWRDADFNGVLPRGTPVAQCVPLKRETWEPVFEQITGEGARRLHDTASAVSREQGVYRRQFRAPKR